MYFYYNYILGFDGYRMLKLKLSSVTIFSLLFSVYCEGRRARGFGGTGKTIFTSLKNSCVIKDKLLLSYSAIILFIAYNVHHTFIFELFSN